MRFLTYEGLDPGRHRAAFDKVRAAIERDDLRSPEVKKLSPTSYHRARLDGGNRLLLQFLRDAARGETVCVALEVIENHAYDRSRFLRGAAPPDEARIAAEPVVATPEAAPIRYVHEERAAVHVLDKPISFDDAQDALLRAPPPLIVVGSAGSGKTALVLARMREAVGAVAYVTHSAYLAESARAIYHAHGWSRDDQEAEFLSHRELVESIRVPEGKPVTFRAFAAFFARHRANLRFTDAHQCFEELRGVIGADPAGPLSRDAYLELGPRQSIFSPREREALHALFERYRAWLDEAKLYDPNLVAQRWLALAEPRYDFLVVDEVQDLTNAELTLALRTLRRAGQFLLSGDANQIVHPNFFSWARLRGLFFTATDDAPAGARRLAVLDANYRNARAITRTANRLLEIKHHRFGSIDRESDALVRAVGDDEGTVSVLPDDDAVVRELDERTRRSARVAVLVLRDEQKEDARRRYRTPLIFSIHEAKGLEYDTVVLHGFVSSERALFAELCDGVRAESLGQAELSYGRARDKSDKSAEIYKFFVNALYVGLTRAVHQVILVERDVAHPLLSLLEVRAERDAHAVRAEASSVDAWQAEARRLEQQGKTEQAEAIRATVARTQPVPWTVIDLAQHDELAAKALAPRSPFTKAKQTLCEWAFFHEQPALAHRLAEAGVARADGYRDERVASWRKVVAPYAARHFRDILDQTDRHGVDHRTPMAVTPLMLAAAAGNAPLVDALLARGARRDAVDPFGRAAMHHVLRMAYGDEEFARTKLGEVWPRVAIPAIDLLVDGRLLRLSAAQGEYFVFAAMIALLPSRAGWHGRFMGVTSENMGAILSSAPSAVLPPERRRREYLNAVLARAEVSSTYVPARKLWVRERRGEYVPNPALAVRQIDERGEERWVSLGELLHQEVNQRHAQPNLEALAALRRSRTS